MGAGRQAATKGGMRTAHGQHLHVHRLAMPSRCGQAREGLTPRGGAGLELAAPREGGGGRTWSPPRRVPSPRRPRPAPRSQPIAARLPRAAAPRGAAIGRRRVRVGRPGASPLAAGGRRGRGVFPAGLAWGVRDAAASILRGPPGAPSCARGLAGNGRSGGRACGRKGIGPWGARG